MLFRSPWWLSGKESTYQCRRLGFNPRVRKIPWRRKWQLTLIFLPGKSHGQRTLAGYSPWGHKESDTTELLNHHQKEITHLLNCFKEISMLFKQKSAAAAKSLQSCLTLCDTKDGSPPGFPVPRILQARTLLSGISYQLEKYINIATSQLLNSAINKNLIIPLH